MSELLRGEVNHKLTLFFFFSVCLDSMGRRESCAGRDSQAVLCRPRLWEWPPGPHPEQRRGKACLGPFLVPSLECLQAQREDFLCWSDRDSEVAWLSAQWLVANSVERAACKQDQRQRSR